MASAAATVLLAGAVAGILDGADAAIFMGWIRGATVRRVFQFIASGLLGTDSFQGGWKTGALGVALHFCIAIGAAATYYGGSLVLPLLTARPAICGPVFGLLVFFFMRQVVIPLSRTPARPFSAIDFVNQIFAHTLLVGLPIGLIISRAAPPR